MNVCLSFHTAPFPSAFGNVVEMRINTKGVGGKLPNFGFVVFDDSEPVQRILGAKVCVRSLYRSCLGSGASCID